MHSTLLERARLDLRSAGYDVIFRSDGWTECFIVHANERWLGRGVSDDDALDDALHQMLPSRLARAEPDSTRPAVAAAAAALDARRVDLDTQLPSVAMRCAERQRLQLMAWVCHARAAEEAFPGARQVAARAQRILHRVATISRMLWPGSVRALRLDMGPAEAMDGEAFGSPPTTWAEAAERAEQRYRERVRSGPAEGLDGDGWIDSGAQISPATNPDAVLTKAAAELEAALASSDDTPSAALDLTVILRIARTVRAVRPTVRDRIAWGCAMGRLRRLSHALPPGPRRSELRNTLDPRVKPPTAWIPSIVAAPDEAARREAATALLAELAELGPGEDAMSAWLRRAFDSLPLHELADRLRSRRAQVVAVAERATPYEDRRDRRRLRDLVERMDPDGFEDAPTSERREISPSEDDDAGPEPGEEGWLESFCDGLRPRTQGMRVLLVGNRSDDKLEARLTELLGIVITTCEGTTRRLQAQCERIARGSYDLVLLASSFQSHSADDTLAHATRAARIAYARVKRGRPLACALAVARALEGNVTSQRARGR